MLNWDEIKPLIDQKTNKIFYDVDPYSLPFYERRKRIYDYLCATLEFDEQQLPPTKNIKELIYDVLINNKGVCNSISYVYKILLEKVGIYSLILFCMDENDIHTITLVANDNNTLSFDDVSIGVYSKKLVGIGIDPESRFDYDMEDAISFNQGVNKLGNDRYAINLSIMINYYFGKNDNHYASIKPNFIDESGPFAEIEKYIKSYKQKGKVLW